MDKKRLHRARRHIAMPMTERVLLTLGALIATALAIWAWHDLAQVIALLVTLRWIWD